MTQPLPYGMFDASRSADEAKRYLKLSSLYHRGQSLAWDGSAVLEALWQKHGGTGLTGQRVAAAQRILGGIMWGELAAWKIAAQLADDLTPLEARMAATSQAHDEARHFYVMHDYLIRATGDFPRRPTRATERLLEAALYADSTPKKLLGMQLQLEAMALTIFHALRMSDVCPVLTELLVYYEKDEARHVGLGMQVLPTLMARMSVRERVAFTAYSIKVGALAIATLKSTEDDLRTLGIDPREIAILGKSKSEKVFDELWSIAPGQKSALGERLSRVLDGAAEIMWPLEPGAPARVKARRVLQTLRSGYQTVETMLDPTGTPSTPPPRVSDLN